MINASLLLAAAVPVILAPIIAALTKQVLTHRKRRDIEIKFKSGERLHLKVDAGANEEQIRNLIRQDERVKKVARTLG
jgi:hypothetical protein